MDEKLTPLQALERIKKAPISYKEETPRFTHTYLQDLDTIETALKDYESRKTLLENIDKDVVVFEPKEVWEEKQKLLKAVEEVKLPKIKKLDDDVFCFEDIQEMVFMSKSKHEEDEKYKKAVEIIKNKNPDLCLLKTSRDFQHYMDLCAMRNEITQEEYDLLKEVLL